LIAVTVLVPFIQYVSQPAIAITRALSQAMAAADRQPADDGISTAAAFAMSAGAVGFFGIYWACWMHARLGNLRIAMRRGIARAEAAGLFCEALLNHGSQSIAMLRCGEKEPQYFGEAHALLHACRAGQDGSALAQALEALVETGTSFSLRARTADSRLLAIRGLPVGGRAVLYFQEEGKGVTHFRDILDALPMPVWLLENNNALTWANSAFLRTFEISSVKEISADKLDWAEPTLCAAALIDQRPLEIRREAAVAGERRSFALSIMPLQDAAVAGIALDITGFAKSETRLAQERDAQADMMEYISTAVAVFDADRRLVRHNNAYSSLWALPDAWLEAHPSYDEILDRLRDDRKLPEQRNFSEWKQEQSRIFEGLKQPDEAFWHMPGGKSLRVIAQPNLLGGVFIQYEDISEKLRLESSLTLLTQVQRATLDTIDDGMAIFGTDGRLALHNSRFAEMWRLTEEELSAQPHFVDVANLCTARIGRDGIWGIVAWGVNSAEPESISDWGNGRRADGRLISLNMARLPNGATVVTFSDLTDLERFNTDRMAESRAASQGQNGFAA
jgi:PAS domain-containing protein